MLPPGCPIYGKIRFLRICITCFGLQEKKDLWTHLPRFRLLPPLPTPLHSRHSRFSMDKQFIFGQIFSDSVRLLPPTPLPFRDSRHFARAELTFSATTRILRLFLNCDWATLLPSDMFQYVLTGFEFLECSS